MNISYVLILIFVCVNSAVSLLDVGKWDYAFSDGHLDRIPRVLYRGSQVFVTIDCSSNSENASLITTWELRKVDCLQDLNVETNDLMKLRLDSAVEDTKGNTSNDGTIGHTEEHRCSSHLIFLKEYKTPSSDAPSKLPEDIESNSLNEDRHMTPLHTIERDGMYLFILKIASKGSIGAKVHIEMKTPYGYLSATDWPLLPFYGFMCIIYFIFGIIWLTVSFLQWRDLLRIQFWIGAVIFIGMIEKALFYEEYQSVNSTGTPSLFGTTLIAEAVSAGKRTLARILVIIVSLGYGIVKPRLGSHLPKIVIVSALYFGLAFTEAYLRVMTPNNVASSDLLLASVPLAFLDSFVCWWIFSSLVQTTRTLKLRRNVVKLTLYTHFTNTLIFAVASSTIFMLYSIKTHQLSSCVKDWRELWVDEGFWHLLFSLILLVIMILWRPTNNNQRYAFSPLLDAPEDDDDDEEVEQFVNDVYGVKLRGMNSREETTKLKSNTTDDDLRWVEENIPPSFIDTAMPILDSDEEIINTKFEISKMQ